MSKIGKAIKFHFTTTKYLPTENQVIKDRTLFLGIKFEKWMLFPASILIQICAGSFYAWSVISAALKEKQYFESEILAYIFYGCVAFFGVASCVSGPWLERSGPRYPALLGASLFFLGNLVSALGVYLKSAYVLFLGFGVLSGAGIGISYLVPVAVLQKYFPNIRGLVSGVAVGAFGLGTLVASFLNELLCSKTGAEFWFIILGVIYFVIQIPMSFVLRFPPPSSSSSSSSLVLLKQQKSKSSNSDNIIIENNDDTLLDNVNTRTTSINEKMKNNNNNNKVEEEEEGPTLSQAIFSKDFLFVYVIFIATVTPGLVFISRGKGIVDEVYNRKNEGAMIIAVLGVFNVLGRLIAGIASDKFGRLPPLIVSILLQVIAVLILQLSLDLNMINSPNVFIFSSGLWLLVLGYGAALGIVPGLLSDCFGPNIVGALYGISLTAWSLAGVVAGLGISKSILTKTTKTAGLLLEKKLMCFGGFTNTVYCLYAVLAFGLFVTISFMIFLRLKKSKKNKLNKNSKNNNNIA